MALFTFEACCSEVQSQVVDVGKQVQMPKGDEQYAQELSDIRGKIQVSLLSATTIMEYDDNDMGNDTDSSTNNNIDNAGTDDAGMLFVSLRSVTQYNTFSTAMISIHRHNQRNQASQ